MCALIEKMVYLNKSKKAGINSLKNPVKRKKVKKSAIQFFISKTASAQVIVLTSTLLVDD